MPVPPTDSHGQDQPRSMSYDLPLPQKDSIREKEYGNWLDTKAERERQRNKFRIPFAIGYGVVAILWLLFTGYVIFQSGLNDPLISVDYRIVIAMLGTGVGALYAPLRILSKFLFS